MHEQANLFLHVPHTHCTSHILSNVDHLWGINAVQCTAGRYMTEVSAEAIHKIRKEEGGKKDRKWGTENFSADFGLRFKT